MMISRGPRWVVKISEIETLPTTFAKTRTFFFLRFKRYDKRAALLDRIWTSRGRSPPAACVELDLKESAFCDFPGELVFPPPVSGTELDKRGVRPDTRDGK